jgi:class 3 adenylate cyclase/tetratricopeptide (TPR) repeat protein
MAIYTNADVEELLRGQPTARVLHELWAQRQQGGAVRWLEDAAMAERFTAHAVRTEEFLLVLDAARETLKSWLTAGEEDRTAMVRVRMNYAFALTRLGFTREARLELEPCVAPGFSPELGRRMKAEVLLRLGDILRQESHDASFPAARIKADEDALSFYKRALELDPDRLDARVLTTSTAFVLGARDEDLRKYSKESAVEILRLTRDLNDSEGPRWKTAWAEATALAVSGDLEAAARAFEHLQTMSEASTARLAATRFEAQLLAEALGQPRDHFKDAFPPLQLIVFAGHLPDFPGSGRVRFPESAVPQVRDALFAQLTRMKARVGLVSASAGADLIFTEALQEAGGTLHLVLPWSREEFRNTSVVPYGPMWAPLYEKALESAATVREIGHLYEPHSEVGWEFTMEVTAGIALNAARAMRLDVQPMVLWDGMPGWGAGGTGDFYNLWTHKLGCDTIVLTPPDSVGGRPRMQARPRKRSERNILHQEVKSILFADVVGYSKLNENTTREFIETFLGRLGGLAGTSKHAPCSVNTWGDGFYAVFDFAHDAGMFALELTQMLKEGEGEWLSKGLYWESRFGDGAAVKHPLNVRVGLHTGPVVMHFDPVVRRIGFTGAHVNRAARIEPVAEPGQVFASEEFAAIAEFGHEVERSEGARTGPEPGFVCEYAGSRELAKNYPGFHRMYRVVPRRPFVVESLAKAAHEDYCEQSRSRGETPTTSGSMRPWDQLSEDLRDSNRAQVADIPNKLKMLGLELVAGRGVPAIEIAITDAQVEDLAIREHERWMAERARSGWTYGPIRDNARKRHPLMVEWDRLSETEKDKDRDTIRNLPRLIERAGFRVNRIG